MKPDQRKASRSRNRIKALLDQCRSYAGPIGTSVREAIENALLHPSAEAWTQIYRCVINARGPMGTRTVWQAVTSVDATCPHRLPGGDKWEYFPDSFTLMRALQRAVEAKAPRRARAGTTSA